ncbi:HAD-IIB family hydrolase [Nocardioides sp. cx-169]|uniref:HAD family hydrolase n=1 Tax=Nocardioides sp. cx-169 TaxID=2899080 RepID=UPI001E63BAB4|nr:HAD-IIB family hydrolase [Nocardioides sp. cx-169]MCD4532919.1 HAD-IIB family hydrolase [Nocardioides sp. cx-169]
MTQPMTRPRLVATDLDGTLVRSDGTVSPRTAGVLAALDASGVPVVFVTARPLRWMEQIWPMVGAHGLAVVSNGAVLYDVTHREVREVRGLGAREGLAVVEAIAAAVPSATFAIECVDGLRVDERFVDVDGAGEQTARGPLAELWTAPVVKLLVRELDADPAELRRLVVDAVGQAAVPTWSVDHLVEISAPGVTKAATLSRVAAELGVSARDVVAFGDMPNDLPMLAWAGTPYAVANAHPDVLRAAGRVAPSNDEDGVAQILEGIYGL